MSNRRPSGASTPGGGWKRVLRGRYKINEDGVLGQGGMATVYKGLDLEALKNVAVKLYSTEPGDCISSQLFKRSVQVLQAINTDILPHEVAGSQGGRRSSFDVNGLDFTAYYEAVSSGCSSSVSMRRQDSAGVDLLTSSDFLTNFDVKSCFVNLLDYSKNEQGNPGMDAEDDALWLVFELGQETLHDVLADCNARKSTLKPKQLRDLQWTLVSIVWGLHAAGYVHLDIKPKNIMKFWGDGREQWKLIDLDGAVHTGLALSLKTVTFTPEYMPPELANAILHRPDDPLTMSRLMDVWSVGMCAMEAIFLQPVLALFYDEWREETGNDRKFYDWLGKFDADPIMSGDMKDYIASISEDMSDLLEGMLSKDPSKRYCIGQCLAHKWFEPVRFEIMAAMNGNTMMSSTLTSERMKYSSSGISMKNKGFGAKSCVVM